MSDQIRAPVTLPTGEMRRIMSDLGFSRLCSPVEFCRRFGGTCTCSHLSARPFLINCKREAQRRWNTDTGLPKLRIADHSVRTVWGMNCLCLLKHWSSEFEPHAKYGCLWVIIPCCIILCVGSGLATGWSQSKAQRKGCRAIIIIIVIIIIKINCHFSISSRLALRPTKLPIQWGYRGLFPRE
jgi:hypothetical protein